MPLTVTMLGCGASGGVPLIGCRCAVCTSDDPKNKRTRVSILIESAGSRLLVDVPPDLRAQCLRHDITRVDGILITHDHADHTHGIDDTRSFNFHADAAVPLYTDKACMDNLLLKFPYIFRERVPEFGWYRPCLLPNVIPSDGSIRIGDMPVRIFKQQHGQIHSLGLRIGDFAYSTDVNHLSEAAFEALHGTKVWIVDCLGYKPAPTHAYLSQTLEWIARVKPERAILTHMSHQLEYHTLLSELPPGVVPGYDGMVVHI